jgi:hypothetical protein
MPRLGTYWCQDRDRKASQVKTFLIILVIIVIVIVLIGFFRRRR